MADNANDTDNGDDTKTTKPLRFYVGLLNENLLPEIPQAAGRSEPHLFGTCADAIASAETDDPELLRTMLRNKVKKCQACGKPNAFTLSSCNSCGMSLVDTAVSFTDNIFTSFLFGIERGSFPYTISVRKQTETALFFDDLLVLSPLHFNAIPTDQWIPDWRYLLRRPAAGLRLVRDLYASCVDIANKQYLSHEAFAAGLLRTRPPAVTSPEDFFLVGFNYPPSQYQLHLQFMAPVLLPQQRHLFERGLHYTHGRFFPVEYVLRCLTLATESNTPLPAKLLREDTDVDAIVAYFRHQHDHDYDAVHAAFLARADALYHRYAKWDRDDFAGEAVWDAATDALVFVPKQEAGDDDDGTETVSDDPARVKQLILQDKLRLQNYGRPYVNGKPQGAYYSFPKKLGDVPGW